MMVRGWYIMGLLSFINFLSGCGGKTMNKEVTHFMWYAVATAPRDYPMKVTKGTFYFKEQDIGIYIPSGGTIHQGWGDSSSAYVGSDDIPPLPDRVSVEFFSYAEKQSYKAEFALPYEKILAMFQKKLREAPEEINYTNFLIGIAPGGAISVWVDGLETLEVYFGQAEKKERSPSAAFDLPFKSKQQSNHYIESALAESVSPEQLAYIKTHGAPIGAWARFRNLYKWEPVYKKGKGATKSEMPAQFLNGERYWIPTRFSEEDANTPKPLPLHLEFRAETAPGGASAFYIIDFEPFELMDAAEKLSVHGDRIYIEFDAQIPRENMKIRLYNDVEPENSADEKEYIELTKYRVKPKA